MKTKLAVIAVLMGLVACAGPGPEERAKALLDQLTLEEKAALSVHDSPAIERLGIKRYNWWNEALHGVARNGSATVFPQPIGASSINSPGFSHSETICRKSACTAFGMKENKC